MVEKHKVDARHTSDRLMLDNQLNYMNECGEREKESHAELQCYVRVADLNLKLNELQVLFDEDHTTIEKAILDLEVEKTGCEEDRIATQVLLETDQEDPEVVEELEPRKTMKELVEEIFIEKGNLQRIEIESE